MKRKLLIRVIRFLNLCNSCFKIRVIETPIKKGGLP